ncbi:MAG: hypothetical protein HY758_09165 [Nitrospirae bacterium]|nr:hypothetical protein [Nitrospirota bacterium]
MKPGLDKIMSADRGLIVIAAISVVLSAFTFSVYLYSKNLENKNSSLTGQLAELQTLNKDIALIHSDIVSRERKIGLTKVTGAVPALQQLLDSLGLKAKVIRSLEKRKLQEFTEEYAELLLEGIDLNAIVNLLYKLENSPFPLKIKNAAIKATFENPNIFILSITASLISK